jgi:alpha-glucosidase
VGGFAGTPRPELLTKWMEIGTFQPMDRNHTNKGSGDKEPWVYGPEQEAIQRRFLEERYRLMPYLYTTAEEMSRTGLPMVRPLFLEFPEAMKDNAPLDVSAGNQFLLGASLVVAPPLFPEQPDDYLVMLPAKEWFDYWTGAAIKTESFNETTGMQEVPVHPTLETLQVFVRGGSILPMQPLVQSTAERPNGPLTLRVYPGPNCQGSLYLDDGSTFDYRKGEYLRLHFSCEKSARGWKVNVGAREGQYKPWWESIQVTVFGWDASEAKVSVQGKALTTGPVVDHAHRSVSVEIPDNEKGNSIEFSAGN